MLIPLVDSRLEANENFPKSCIFAHFLLLFSSKRQTYDLAFVTTNNLFAPATNMCITAIPQQFIYLHLMPPSISRTLDFSRTNFCFPWRFEKLGFYCVSLTIHDHLTLTILSPALDNQTAVLCVFFFSYL